MCGIPLRCLPDPKLVSEKGPKISPKIESQSLKGSGIVSIACLRALVVERNSAFRAVHSPVTFYNDIFLNK